MDLATAGISIFGPIITKALMDVYSDWRTKKKAPRGAWRDERGNIDRIDNRGGVINLTPELSSDFEYSLPPIRVSGKFLFEPSLACVVDDCLEEYEQIVLLAIIDHSTERSYFFQFEFIRYDITIWNGDYSFYAFVVDPQTNEVLGEGYPFSEDLRDPNPIFFEGEGIVEMDMYIIDVSDRY